MRESGFNFIVGIGRSGTTLLMSMLNAHPTIQATPEVNFFVFFHNSWKNKTTFKESDFKRVELYVSLFKRRKHASGFDWSIDLFREYIQQNKKINFAIIYQCFYKSFVYAGTPKNITHNFDKNPINTLFLNDIIEQLPNAKFVFLVRDPRANYLSRKEKINFRKPNIYADSYRWAFYNESTLALIEKHKDKFYVLKYEDLVSNARFYLNELAEFFDFKNEEDMLNFHLHVKENSLRKVTEDSDNVHVKAKEKYEKLSRPVNTDRLEAWKQKLSKEEIEINSRICRVANYFGYHIDGTKPKYNYFKYYWGIYLAKREIVKNKLVYRLPLSIKLKLSNLFGR
jgi:hypothetical protein